MSKSNGAKLVLVVSMVGLGSFVNMPAPIMAMENQTGLSSTTNDVQQTNTLSKLEVDGVQLNQDLSPGVYDYSASVNNSIQSVTLNVGSDNPDAIITVTVNNQTITNANGTVGPFSLQTGDNKFLITVDDKIHTPNTYTLTITRKQNANNLLQNITLSNGELSPQFSSDITEYTVDVANEVNSLTVSPQACDNTESIKINDSIWKNDGISVQLPVGKSDIVIMVTAENGDVKAYTLHITREAEQAYKPPVTPPKPRPNETPTKLSSNGNGANPKKHSGQPQSKLSQNSTSTYAQQNKGAIQNTSTAILSSLTVSEGTWVSSFSSDKFTYHIAVSSDVTSVTINPTATYSSASILLDGSNVNTIQLTRNPTIVPIVVTNGEDRKTYVLVFDKPVQPTTTTETSQISTDTTVNTTTNKPTSLTATQPYSNLKPNKGNSKTSTSFWQRILDFFKMIF
jgi:hypothetical protein